MTGISCTLCSQGRKTRKDTPETVLVGVVWPTGEQIRAAPHYAAMTAARAVVGEGVGAFRVHVYARQSGKHSSHTFVFMKAAL